MTVKECIIRVLLILLSYILSENDPTLGIADYGHAYMYTDICQNDKPMTSLALSTAHQVKQIYASHIV